MSEETKPKQTRQGWTKDEDQTILDNTTVGAAALAVMLNRPVSQIRNRAARLGVSVRREGEKRGRKSSRPQSLNA